MARDIVRDPVYKQVTEALLELIRSEFAAGEKFLTERQVSERFGISRTTANKALASLEIDGVLEFRTGVGTFVRPPKPNVNLRRLVSFTEKARATGLRPHTAVRSFHRVPIGALSFLPPAEVSTVLELDDEEHVYEMERLRSLDGEPVIYERRALRADLCPDLVRDDVGSSLYTVLQERYALALEGVAQRIRARNASAGEARLLDLRAGDAVLELTGVGHLTDGRPLWYEETLYRGDTYEFVNQLRLSGDESQSSLDPRQAAASGGDETKRPWYRWD